MRKTFTRLLVVFIAWQANSFVLGQASLPALNVAHTQDFNTLISTGTAEVTTLPAGWLFLEAGTNANTQFAAGTGSSNTGNTYSLGLDADRALGGLQSGSLIPTLGAAFTNNTGASITFLQIVYTGEQWRLGATPRAQADRLDFQISMDATSVAAGTWTDVNELDFNSPILVGTVGALNGNLAANRTQINYTITGLSIPAGATFWIRWLDFNVTSSDDALAVDDFAITPSGIPSNQPTLTLIPSSLNFGEVNLGASKVLSYLVKGANLSDSLTLTNTTSPAFSLSLDLVDFYDTLAVADSTLIYVKFTPDGNGAFSDNIIHSNDTLVEILPLSGSGYDPINNIIPIATARSLSAGTKVTVAGRITVANQFASPSYVQDATGGMPVFDSNFSSSISIGDSVIVTGPIGVFNEQIQISGSGISFIMPDSSQRILNPKVISIDSLAVNEGLLVTVEQIELVNKSFVFYPQSTEQITNGTITADLRIDGDTNLPGLSKPQAQVDITGVVGRFRANAQLLPRFRDDVPGANEPQTPADSIPSSSTFDVVNWNLEFFGAEREAYPQEYGPANELLQLQNVQHVLSNIQGDVIALQEVSSDVYFDSLVNQLPGYKGICSPRYSYSFEGASNFPPQKVCYLYDTATVTVLSHQPMFVNLYDSARLINPALLPGYPTGEASSFWSSGRLPFLLTAKVNINGVSEKIHFINIHAKSGATLGDLNRRAYDAQVLKDSLDAHFVHEQVIILGDWNDDFDQSIVTGQPSSFAMLVTDTASYNAITLPLSLAGAKSTVSFNDVIDHQMITSALNEEYIPQSANIIAPFGMIPNYGTTTSDHLPVMSRYAFVPTVISLAITEATVVEGDSAQIQLQFSKPVAKDTYLTFAIIHGTGAEYGADYSTIPAASTDTLTILIPTGSVSASVPIATIDDVADELSESIMFILMPQTGIELSDSTSFLLTILDNEPTTVEFVETEIGREEGSGAYEAVLRLSTPLASAQSVTLFVQDGITVMYGNRLDYTTSPAVERRKIVLNIPVGVQQVSFQVTPNSDNIPERRPEAITFTIQSVSADLRIGTANKMVFNIIDVRPCLPVFVVFPNPTHGAVNIKTLPSNEDSLVQGTLYAPNGDVLGSHVGTVEQLSEQFTTVLEGRRRGIYTLRLIQCDEIITIRILKI
jgi:hypothetical protein